MELWRALPSEIDFVTWLGQLYMTRTNYKQARPFSRTCCKAGNVELRAQSAQQTACSHVDMEELEKAKKEAHVEQEFGSPCQPRRQLIGDRGESSGERSFSSIFEKYFAYHSWRSTGGRRSVEHRMRSKRTVLVVRHKVEPHAFKGR